MRQIWIPKFGAPDVLSLKEAPDPQPGAGELRIRVEASGVNVADIMGRMGLYPDLPPTPVVPGYEVAGKVDAVGANVDTSWIGRDIVAMTRFGGYADVVCTPSAQVFRTSGTADPAQYNGGANTEGYVLELAYVPWGKPDSPLYWLNARVGLQYVGYTEFNGARQHAGDNNTLYANLWIALAPLGSRVRR